MDSTETILLERECENSDPFLFVLSAPHKYPLLLTRALFLPIKIGGAAPTVYHAPASISVDNVGMPSPSRIAR